MASQIQIILAGLTSAVEGSMKKTALDIAANLVQKPSSGGTPVDTGWARANWIASVASPVTNPVGDPENVQEAAGAQAAGLLDVLTYSLLRGPIFITNNVPYITRLNDGSSKQAAAGFVQAAIQKASSSLG
jgi:hypothetical protein